MWHWTSNKLSNFAAFLFLKPRLDRAQFNVDLFIGQFRLNTDFKYVRYFNLGL